MKNLIILILIFVVIAMGGYLIVNNKNLEINSSTTPSSPADNNGFKTFTFDSFHGRTNVSDKFQFQYPATWYNEGQYFSPEKIKYYDLYSVKAPL